MVVVSCKLETNCTRTMDDIFSLLQRLLDGSGTLFDSFWTVVLPFLSVPWKIPIAKPTNTPRVESGEYLWFQND